MQEEERTAQEGDRAFGSMRSQNCDADQRLPSEKGHPLLKRPQREYR